jgi:hypothetical protein
MWNLILTPFPLRIDSISNKFLRPPKKLSYNEWAVFERSNSFKSLSVGSTSPFNNGKINQSLKQKKSTLANKDNVLSHLQENAKNDET